MADKRDKREALPKLKRTDSQTIDPRMPWTQTAFIKTIKPILEKHDRLLKRKKDEENREESNDQPDAKKKKED